MIEVEVKLKSGPMKFQFRKMSIEEATEWASKIRSRMSYKDSIRVAILEMDKQSVLDRDMDKYLELQDKEVKLDVQIAEASKSMSKYVTDPAQDVVVGLLDTDTAAVVGAFSEFLSKAFPSQEETKKS